MSWIEVNSTLLHMILETMDREAFAGANGL